MNFELSHLIDAWLIPGLILLGDWSVRWAILILLLMTGIACHALRSAALRSVAARLVLIAGFVLPVIPVFWGPVRAVRTSNSTEPVVQPDLTELPVSIVPAQQLSTIPVILDDEAPLPQRPTPLPSTRPAPDAQQSSGLVRARPRLGFLRWAAMTLAGLYVAGVLLQLTRLLTGWWWLTRLCRNASPVSSEDQAEFERCRQRLGVSRQVQFKIHPQVAAPIVVGGWRPCVLVPASWEGLPVDSRIAILLHELAHVRRYDDASHMFEEFVRAVFFFHPLVHWLLSRIGAEREELCDGAVIQQGIEPRALAGVLLEACRVFGTTRHGLPGGLVLPFFRQRSVKDRIQSLMEESTMSRGRLPLSRRVCAALGTGLTACAVLIAGFGIQAQEPPPVPVVTEASKSTPPTATPASPPNAAPQLAIDLSNHVDLSALIVGVEQMKALQAGLPIDVPGFGKLGMDHLATLAYGQMAEAPRGRLVDIEGKPLSLKQGVPLTAIVTALSYTPNCVPGLGESVLADSRGQFGIITGAGDRGPAGPGEEDFEPHESVPLLVKLPGGQTFETLSRPVPGKVVDVVVPTHQHPQVAPPQTVAKDEIAGVVVDEQGRALPGVEVDLYDFLDVVANKVRAVTDDQGQFRLRGIQEYVGEDGTTVIRFRKAGFSPERFLHQPLGVKGWVVALAGRTYLEGTVKGPDGKPVAGAPVRGHQGPREVASGILPDLWTDTVSDASGKYRLYVQPGEYELYVKAPGAGVARIPKQTVYSGDKRPFDIDLKPGVKFQALVVDSITNKPVPDVRLWHWQHPGVEGRSDREGKVTISDMLPGDFEFMIEAKGYARWWSQEAKSEWCRLEKSMSARHVQCNFNDLDFVLKQDMPVVKIVVEQGVRVSGRVVDPDGNPVAGATADCALSGHGSSVSGDTRYSARTAADGTFTMLLPASHSARYNLVAHDGDYQQWRRWANAILPPIQTKPGDELKDVELRLTRPAVVRGKVVNEKGEPLPGFNVIANSEDQMESRYYAPTTGSKADGTFELPFVRPGKHVIRAEMLGVAISIGPQGEPLPNIEPPFVAADGVPDSFSAKPSEPLTLTAGQVTGDIVLVVQTSPAPQK